MQMRAAQYCTAIPWAVAGLALTMPTLSMAQRPIAFTHVNVIDGAASKPRVDQTVVIRGTRITAVGPSRSTAAPAGARVVDARGMFLLPGLWDMHVHTSIIGGRALLALYVANGVTGVRDMAGDWDTLTKWRREIAANQLVGPRLIASGPYLEGGDVPIPHILTRTPEEGIAGVDSLVKLGVDFIKVHGQLTRPTYFAIARRAREKGIPFAGHVSQAVGSADASDSGHIGAMPAAEVATLSRYLRTHDHGARYEFASATAVKSAALIAHDGRPVLMLDALARQPILPSARLRRLPR